MDVKLFASALTERNERLRKPVPVKLSGAGTVYVRLVMIDEAGYAEQVRAQGDGAGDEANLMLWLTCHESGERLTEEEREILLPVYATCSRADYNSMWTAATGSLSAADDNSGN